MSLALIPRSAQTAVNRFAHALMLKLTHGIVSWLVGREVPVQNVVFAFSRPSFAADYPILFPAPITFQGKHSQITFRMELGRIRPERNTADVRVFLERAPRDWIFTSYRQHAMRLKVRELLYVDLGRTLDDVSRELHISSRTLLRKLEDESMSFQGIKDELRRDLAILNLVADASLTEISYALGFSSPAVFHRAFRHWTGMTPGVYRAAQKELR
jgi:AraC-like DNA-binding protein